MVKIVFDQVPDDPMSGDDFGLAVVLAGKALLPLLGRPTVYGSLHTLPTTLQAFDEFFTAANFFSPAIPLPQVSDILSTFSN